MKFDYTQLFLLIWIIAFWLYYSLTYGKFEGKYERSVQQTYRIKPKWGRFFGFALLGWTVTIVIYSFHFDSINWIWKLSFLDRKPIKIAAMVVMCSSFLLYVLFTMAVGGSIRSAVTKSEKPKLITTGIYRYIRHPCYTAIYIKASGIFLIIPNVFTLLLLMCTCVVIYGHTLEEEQKLMRIYGEEYGRYSSEVGRFFPKLW